jgi:hypothetical protein
MVHDAQRSLMMRLLLLGLSALAFSPAVAGPQQPVMSAPPTIDPATGQPVKCRKPDAQLAGRVGPAPIEPLRPQKLTKLPPATGYMAVYRHIGGCNAPLTMVEYRNLRRR